MFEEVSAPGSSLFEAAPQAGGQHQPSPFALGPLEPAAAHCSTGAGSEPMPAGLAELAGEVFSHYGEAGSPMGRVDAVAAAYCPSQPVAESARLMPTLPSQDTGARAFSQFETSASLRTQEIDEASVATSVAWDSITAPTQRSMLSTSWSTDCGEPAQGHAEAGVARPEEPVSQVAARGIQGSGGGLPFQAQIQKSFGRYDLSHVRAHQDEHAAAAAQTIGAKAYASGDRVAFAGEPTLHTAAHEAAHVVQQQAGVQLAGGVGQAGDPYEQHADAVADLVVQGKPAESLLSRFAGPKGSHGASQAVQRKESNGPKAGINKPGFIDRDDGANIRNVPALAPGSQPLTAVPLPPASRVFVSGYHPEQPDWWYVTALFAGQAVRGYVQEFRVATDLPEPQAKLYQIKSGDAVERLARSEFRSGIRDGHDLRYYENVLLAVNRDKGRTGITGSYQDPNLFGGGSNNIQLVAGQRIWLVSPAYASALEGVVPSGSLTGGRWAKVKRVVGHLKDIVLSVAECPQYFRTVAGEVADAILEHLPEIIGIVTLFLYAECASAFLAASPTGVGQIAAAVIQLALAAFGVSVAAAAAKNALQNASNWLTLAWQANGDAKKRANASKEFLRMLVEIAMAALAILGVRGNFGRALKIKNQVGLPKVELPAAEGELKPGSLKSTVAEEGASANPRTRLPRSKGRWQGSPGNGLWYSEIPEVNAITGGKPIEFVNGRPNFSPWRKGKIEFKSGELNGSAADFQKVYEYIAKKKGLPSRAAAERLLKEQGLTPHHASETVIELIPSDLHNNIPHIGSASDLRGGF